jgi:hypothetical protein
MGEKDNPRPSPPQAEFQPPPESSLPVTKSRGTVIRVRRPVAVFALALLIIGVLFSGYLLAGKFSGISPFHFFGGLLSLCAVMLAIFFVIVLRKMRAIRHWAPAMATVEESAAVWGVTSSGGRTARTWLPRFTYRYEVGERVYRAGRIAFYRRCTGSCAQELVARHPAGSQVQVYYDPARPAEAVLDRSFRALWVLPFFAVVCGGLAAVFFKLPELLPH